MKIAYVSNFYNHHQAFVSRNLYRLTEGNYKFITTTDVPEERKSMGYSESKDNFVLEYSLCPAIAQNWIDTSDIVIFGSAPKRLLAHRKKEKKIIFKYSEHLFKKGIHPLKFPYQLIRARRENSKGVPIYMLCASAYTASDYAKFGLFKGKCYKWGYFPECKRYGYPSAMIESKDSRKILWCGRFLDWKHPDDVLTVAERLRADGYDFHINIIGTGEMEEELHRIHGEKKLQDNVTFLGAMSPDKVREQMEKSGIYLFTSDHKEGWGAVLNEAMNSGCAVVASDLAGSTTYLINDNENGFIYKSGDVDTLYDRVKHLLDNAEEQRCIGSAAYVTIADQWNSDVAAERLFKLFEAVLAGNESPELFEDGPISRA